MLDAHLISEINTILDEYGSCARLDITDPIFSVQGLVMDASVQDRPISRLLTGLLSQPIHDGDFYHYTSGDAVKKICASRILRLTSVKKRLNECEINEFLNRFGFDYPLQLDPNSGIPNFHTSIAPRIFYASFTETDTSKEREQYFWDQFSQSDGARLKFQFHLKSGHLRRISYGENLNRALHVFKKINVLVAKFGHKGFFWDDVGLACALHLPNQFRCENEVRLIANRNCGLTLGCESGFEYLELPFGPNSHLALDIKLIEVQTNRSDLSSFGFRISPRA